MARDAYMDARDFERLTEDIVRRLLSLPTQALVGVSAASSAAAIYFAWIGFVPIWLSAAQAASAFLPALLVAAASTAMFVYRTAARDPYDVWPVARKDLETEIDEARRDPGSPAGYVTRLRLLKLRYLELTLKRQFAPTSQSKRLIRTGRRTTDHTSGESRA